MLSFITYQAFDGTMVQATETGEGTREYRVQVTLRGRELRPVVWAEADFGRLQRRLFVTFGRPATEAELERNWVARLGLTPEQDRLAREAREAAAAAALREAAIARRVRRIRDNHEVWAVLEPHVLREMVAAQVDAEAA